MSLTEIIQTIKSIVKDVQWSGLFRSPWWFITIHFPYIIRCLVGSFGKPGWRNKYWNTAIWDGLTRNDFKRGKLIEFLFKLNAIKQPYNWESDEDGRGYWIGYQNDD